MKIDILISVIVIMLSFFSTNTYGQFRLEKKDEFKINSFFPVELVAYSSKFERFVGYINKFKNGVEIAIVNKKGEILNSKKLKGEGPEEYLGSLNCLGFSEEGDIWVLTTHELLLYDQKFKLIEKSKFESKNNFYLYGNTGPFAYFFNNNASPEISFITFPTSISKFIGLKDFRNQHLVEIYDTKKKIAYEILPITERKNFKSLDKSIEAMYQPVFTVMNDRLYITTSFDKEITEFDLSSNKITSSTTIKHGDFKALDASSISSSNLPSYEYITLAPKNHRIYKLDEKLLAIEYIREIPLGIYEKKRTADPRYHHFKDPDYHRLILFDGSQQISEDIKIPYGELKFALEGNAILVKLLNPDFEEDFIRYGIFEFKKE